VIISMLMSPVHLAVLVSAFAIVWFLALFCLIPVGLGAVDPETGAPLSPYLGTKALIALGIASVLWTVFYVLIRMGVLQL
jgi:predicted secreted protein